MKAHENCHIHGPHTETPLPPGAKKIVLVGNPNVGKSVFFGLLTGMYTEVSNYPGTTVEIASGNWHEHTILDTPGIYGVSSFNDEEIVARDIILHADVILNIVDSTHLERDLFLTQQLIDLGKRVVIALNFYDEVKKSGISIDVHLMSELLGVEVIPTTAIAQIGFKEVTQALLRARPGRQNPELHGRLHRMLAAVGSQSEALMILEGDVYIAERHGLMPLYERENLYIDRRNRVNDVLCHVICDNRPETSFREKLGRAAVNPLTGVPILFAVLYAMYKIIGVWVAGHVVGFTEEIVMQGHYEPWIRSLVSGFISADSIAGQILIGEFGLLTMTITYLLGLLFPLVLGFYAVLSILEDSGYLSRLATLVDRLMTMIGLNGRAVIPIILGFGCVQLGTITTRLLATKREKSITTVLLNFAVPCSAQIGVIAGMLAVLGGKMMALYIAIIFTVLAVAGTILNRTIPGKSSSLLIDLPPMRLPKIENILRKTTTAHFSLFGKPTRGSFSVPLL